MAEETFYRDQILCMFATLDALLDADAIIARSKEYKENRFDTNTRVHQQTQQSCSPIPSASSSAQQRPRASKPTKPFS